MEQTPFEIVLRHLDALTVNQLTDLQGFIKERLAELLPRADQQESPNTSIPPVAVLPGTQINRPEITRPKVVITKEDFVKEPSRR